MLRNLYFLKCLCHFSGRLCVLPHFKKSVKTYIMLVFLVTVKINLYFLFISIPNSVFSAVILMPAIEGKCDFEEGGNPIWVF